MSTDIRTVRDGINLWLSAEDIAKSVDISWNGAKTLKDIDEDLFTHKNVMSSKGLRKTLCVSPLGAKRLVQKYGKSDASIQQFFRSTKTKINAKSKKK